MQREITNQSRHYARQTPFGRSHRQLRSTLLKTILQKESATHTQLLQFPPAGRAGTEVGKRSPAPTGAGRDKKEVERALAELTQEGFIKEKHGIYKVV